MLYSGHRIKSALTLMQAPNSPVTSEARTGVKRPGKRPRKPHPIYFIEKTLGLNHVNIADLASSSYLTIDEIEAVVTKPLGTRLASDLKAADVAKIILGESPKLWTQVRKRLAFRLGIDINSLDAIPMGLLLSTERVVFSKKTVADYHRWFRQSIEDDRKAGLPLRNELFLQMIDRLTFL